VLRGLFALFALCAFWSAHFSGVFALGDNAGRIFAPMPVFWASEGQTPSLRMSISSPSRGGVRLLLCGIRTEVACELRAGPPVAKFWHPAPLQTIKVASGDLALPIEFAGR